MLLAFYMRERFEKYMAGWTNFEAARAHAHGLAIDDGALLWEGIECERARFAAAYPITSLFFAPVNGTEQECRCTPPRAPKK